MCSDGRDGMGCEAGDRREYDGKVGIGCEAWDGKEGTGRDVRHRCVGMG